MTKWLVAHYPVGEILLIQASLIALLTSSWMRLRDEALLQLQNWRQQLTRGLLYALRLMPFAEVVATAFTGPLFMTLFGHFILAEI